MRKISTEIDIDAPPEQIWSILTDFARYPEWNTFILKIRGRPQTGSRILFVFELPRGFRAPAYARILAAEPHKNLRWAGGIPGILRAEHYHAIESVPGSGTRFSHGEIFTGFLVPIIWRLFLARSGPPVYSNMNRALKRRAEGKP